MKDPLNSMLEITKDEELLMISNVYALTWNLKEIQQKDLLLLHTSH